MPSLRTRTRAWLLRTFKGRSREDAAWEDASTWVSSPPQTFSLGALEIAATPLGVKAAGANRPSAVYEVRVNIAGHSRSWSSRYGLLATDNSARQAAESALDELDQLWRDPEGWKRQALAGMSEVEVEAMEESSSMRADLKAATWIGPELDAVRGQTRDGTGAWLSEKD
jgi:hypothetical protein